MLTQILPKTLRNTMFVVGMVMISASAAMGELGMLDPSSTTPDSKSTQCADAAPEVKAELNLVS